MDPGVFSVLDVKDREKVYFLKADIIFHIYFVLLPFNNILLKLLSYQQNSRQVDASLIPAFIYINYLLNL